jgi:hypothetical protein
MGPGENSPIFSRVCRADTNCTRVFCLGVLGWPSCRTPKRCSLPKTDPDRAPNAPRPDVPPDGEDGDGAEWALPELLLLLFASLLFPPPVALPEAAVAPWSRGRVLAGDAGITSTPLRLMSVSQDSRWPRRGVSTSGSSRERVSRGDDGGGANENRGAPDRPPLLASECTLYFGPGLSAAMSSRWWFWPVMLTFCERKRSDLGNETLGACFLIASTLSL